MMDYPSILNCEFTLNQCNKTWQELKSTKNNGKKFCLDCQKTVIKVNRAEDLKSVIEDKKCVAYFIDKRKPLLGMISDYESIKIKENNKKDI